MTRVRQYSGSQYGMGGAYIVTRVIVPSKRRSLGAVRVLPGCRDGEHARTADHAVKE